MPHNGLIIKSVIVLPKHIYENISGAETIISEAKRGEKIRGWAFESVEYGDGIEISIEGADYPQKGYAPPEAVWAVNTIKSILIEAISIVTMREGIGAFAIMASSSFKRKLVVLKRVIDGFNKIGWSIISPYILKEQYQTPFTREIQKLTYRFLIHLGFTSEFVSGFTVDPALKFSKIFAHAFEYDNAYRLRVQDLFNETTKEAMVENPRKEIKRLIDILGERDMEYVADKFRKIGTLISVLLLHSQFKDALVKALSEADFSKLQPDENDRYWMCHREDYKFFGKSHEERKQMLTDAGLSIAEGRLYDAP